MESALIKNGHLINKWYHTGITAGLIACITYPLMVFVPMPHRQLTLLRGASFGPALAMASVALTFIMLYYRKSVITYLAGIANALAGTLVTAMIIVQLSVRWSTVQSDNTELTRIVKQYIWDVILGLDVVFDVFIGLGTIFFGFSMLKDPRFGRIIGWASILISTVFILGFNFYSFPVPPVDAGLLDPGPVTRLWYLVVVIAVTQISPKSPA